MLLSWPELESVLDCGRHTLLFGPPSTSKTHTAVTRTLPGGISPVVYNITLTAETPAAELRGHYIPKGSEFIWHDGPGIKAWRMGCRLVLNELPNASGDTQNLLYALLDNPDFARMTLPTGETVRPAAGFQVIGTMNGDPATELPPALLDRFAIRILVDEPHPTALARLPEPLARIVKNTAKHEDDRRVSLRQALAYHGLQQHLTADLAAKAVFGNRAPDIFNSIVLAIAKDGAK